MKRSGMGYTANTLQVHHTCLYLVSIYQTVPLVSTVCVERDVKLYAVHTHS